MQDISIMSLIFTAALTLVCLFLILSPFFKLGSLNFHFHKSGQEFTSTKEALLTTLNELEFEYKMDKISAADYQHLKKQYEAEITRIMKDEEQGAKSAVDSDIMAEVEKEIASEMKNYKNKKGEGK
ncbi:hypothetical protein [Neobacillus mesonae]|uniref:hypothetical protein n=1 Tax=Neobacillus mesonae TaxID=1193713 RepID=UPI00257434E6|nr:hypothetical protein [Neobacillus mesonae]MED4204364.1 hypothetical protein [Neobacillus mesonae]